MDVLYVTAEALPFSATGGLGEVSLFLPRALKKHNVKIKVVLPLYREMFNNSEKNLKHITDFNVAVGWRNQQCGLYTFNTGTLTYYFIKNDYYFDRDNYYGYSDEAERFAFYNRAVLEMLKYIDYYPDIIHCNDWHTALIPAYLRYLYNQEPSYGRIRTVLTIHSLFYQGQFPASIVGDVIDLPVDDPVIYNYDSVNFLKAGIEMADYVTTISPSYAQEIQTQEFSFGLLDVLQRNKHKISGILNGIDYKSYDPDKDKSIFSNYNKKNIKNKTLNKAFMQRMFDLKEDPDIPLLCMVTRLSSPKGIDLVVEAFDNIMTEQVQFIILGSGERKYELFFENMSREYENRMGCVMRYVPEMSRKFFAAADIFIMPSFTEPLGIASIIAMNYGAVPLVRATGGLKDLVRSYGSDRDEGYGFTFDSYSPQALESALKEALSDYGKKELWNDLRERAMSQRFDWSKPASSYYGIYCALTEQDKTSVEKS